AAARSAGDLLVHVRHESLKPDATIFVPGSPGVDFHPLVRPLAGEHQIVKNFPNAFHRTGLKALLDSHGITQIVIVGAMSHMCIPASARAATECGYETITVHDACATLDLAFDGLIVPAAEVHATNMAALAYAFGKVVATDAIVAERALVAAG